MALLKQRERNYRAVEVTDSILHAPIDGKVYTFIGLDEARERFEHGIQTQTAVISKNYENSVRDAFRSRGAAAYENYLNSTEKSDQLRTLPLKLHKV